VEVAGSKPVSGITFKMNPFLLRKLALWALSCLVISFLFLNKIRMPSWSYLHSHGLYPWAVLFLCVLWIYIKRGEQIEAMVSEPEKFSGLPFIFLGVLALAASLLLPKDVELPSIVFEMLLAYLGLFVIFFGRAALIPTVLLGIYGFSVGFPVGVAKYLDPQYSLATVWMVVTALKTSGFQLMSQGQVISFLNANGREMSVFIDAACSGSASMAIFIAIFALMMLDIRLPNKSALYMLAFGVVGMTVQNVIRLIVIILAGHYYDYRGISVAHDYAGYILFPAWFFVFAYVYLKYAKRLGQGRV